MCPPGHHIVNDTPRGSFAYGTSGIVYGMIPRGTTVIVRTRPLRWLSTACAAVVRAVGPPVIASRPIYIRVGVRDAQDLSRHFLGAP